MVSTKCACRAMGAGGCRWWENQQKEMRMTKSPLERMRICRRCGKPKAPPRDSMSSICVDCEGETDCKHDADRPPGPMRDDYVCSAGVCVKEIIAPMEGCYMRLPCRWMQGGAPVKCDKFEPIGRDAAIAWDRAIEEQDRRMQLVLPVVGQVKKDHRGQNWSGSVDCPTGCGGTLHLSHAACNGHVWGKCSTDNCVGWME